MSRHSGFPKHVLNKTSVITGQLMKTCLELNVTPANACESFETLYSFTEELINLQKKFYSLRNLEIVGENRENAIKNLCNMHSDAFEHPLAIKDCGVRGLGFTTDTPLKAGTKVLRVPRQLMLDTCGAWDLASFVQQDPIASGMENIALSLRVLSELIAWKKSDWFDYICALPSIYSTFLYMTPNDVKQLKGSPVLAMVVSNYQSICRQYAYFFKRFETLRLPILRTFCFEDFRWAVSTVMSRNNLIPTGTDLRPEMCLIPIWDMINHKPGQVTTDFDPITNELIFYAMESCNPGDEVLMDYGKRTNAEFLLFAGFVPTHNPHNRLSVNLAISKSDTLAPKKQQLLEVVALTSPLNSLISMDPSSLSDLIAFSRVFVMTEDQIEHHLSHPDQAVEAIRNASLNLVLDNDRKAVNFLTQRIGLLIMMYGKILDEAGDQFTQLTTFEKQCMRLKQQEIEILRASVTFLHNVTSRPNDPVTCLHGLSINDQQHSAASVQSAH